MYIRRKVFSCVEEKSFAEGKKKDGKKKWSPVDEEFVRMSNEADKNVRRAYYKLSGGYLGALGGAMIPAAISDMSSNETARKVGRYAILPAAAVGSYAGYKAGKKYHEKNSHLKADLEEYEQLSPRDREKYRQLKGVSLQGKL